jgi:vacuolar-type H+-ATPase subunit H
VQDARVRLGTMYDPEDYPDAHALKMAYAIDVEFFPVPDANDFRVDVAKETQDEIKQQITASVNARVEQAVRDCWSRAREVLERINKQCSNKKGRIHDSLMENAQDLVNVLGGLNITGDPKITQMETDIRAIIVHPDMIRNNPVTRQRVADGAADILSRMAWN